MSNLIIVKDLHKYYRKGTEEIRVLTGINLEVAAGEFVSIEGVSGVGKSTLLHLMGGLDRPTSGEILIDGVDLTRYTDWELAAMRNARIGFVFQFHHLLHEFTALENVALPLLIRGVDKSAANKDAADILEKVGLSARLTHIPPELSGGERQRVAIARALVGKPSVVLADEPTGDLDQATGREVGKLMRELNRELGQTIVIATHNRELAAEADRRLRLVEGHIAAE